MTAPHAVSRTTVLLCVALLSAAGVATGCGSDDTSRFEHTTVKMHAVAEPVRAIVVKAQSGDIDLIQMSASSSVRETQHYDATRPRFTQHVTGGVLTIESDCGGAQCEVDLRVAVPSGAKVDVDVASGNIQARAINVRDAHLRSRSGNVASISSATSSESGHIRARATSTLPPQTHGLSTRARNRATSRSMPAATRDASQRTQSGNVTVTVPRGDYALDAKTDSGNVKIDGIVHDDRAPKSVVARTTSGNVSLRAG